jgi:hypothetical protein
MSNTETVSSTSVGRAISVGITGGIFGSLAMALYAMVISGSVKHAGYFTPIYHIASSMISGKAMMTSLLGPLKGQNFFFDLGPAIGGALIHLTVGAITGAIFGVLISKIHASREFTVVAGTMFGLLVLVVNGFVGLPIASHLFGGGKPISDMANIVGWGHFTGEHAIFGIVLGIVVAIKLGHSYKSTNN